MYDKQFYAEMDREDIINNKSSAKVIVPIVMDLLHPESVLDIGCATGVWLNIFKQAGGIKKILGVDGQWVNRRDLVIDPKEFLQTNLEKDIRSKIKDKYDLVTCLEVAEHIDLRYEDVFINNLISCGDVILFSAAIPDQGGEHHVNEQWQSHWAYKFKRNGFILIDCIRPRIWYDSRVSYCYKQNLLLFVKRDRIERYENLKHETKKNERIIIDIIHPQAYEDNININQSLSHLIKMQRKLLKVFGYKLVKQLLSRMSKES